MAKELWEKPWVRQVVVLFGYGIVYLALLAFTPFEWQAVAGLRLAALLLVPYRYWLGLIGSEAAYYIVIGYVCSDNWGAAWGLSCAVPPIAYVAPIVYWARKCWPPTSAHAAHIHMGRLLGCALLSSIPVMLRDTGMFQVIKHLPAGYDSSFATWAPRYFIGCFLGTLTVTPFVLLCYQELGAHRRWSELQGRIENSRLLFESVCLGLPVLALLLWIGYSAAPSAPMRQMAQVAMFLPVVWLAFRHGWPGAAMGGAAASCAVMLLMPKPWDPATLQAEAILSLAISTMLMMGARIGSLDQHVEQDRIDVRMALALAQRNVYLGEMQLRITSQALEQIREGVQAGFAMMLGRLRHLQPAIDDRGYQRHALVAQEQLHRLADSLYPVALREKGLPSALQEGGLPQMLSEAGLSYSCDLRGPVSKLSNPLRMAIYRVIWEAVADACMKKNVSDVRIQVRVAERQGRIGVLIVARFRAHPAQLAFVEWDELIPRLVRGSSGLGLRAVRDRAAVFEGRTRSRSIATGHQISVLLLDPVMPGVAIGSTGQWMGLRG